jgi:DNA-binding MarR family transcriptional regulator
MTDQPGVQSSASKERLPDEVLETSQMLVEFLHAAYATRNQETPAGEPVEVASDGRPLPNLGPVSGHALRAAIHVYQHGERTVGQIASGLGISYGWASRVVEELETVGYVIRERDLEDRRVVRVRLNPNAMQEVRRALRWRAEAVATALEPLSESERDAVRKFLKNVTGLLREGIGQGAQK